jgi:hypothetical protein
MNLNDLLTPCGSLRRTCGDGLNLSRKNTAVAARMQERQSANEIGTEIWARPNGVPLNPGPRIGIITGPIL